MRNAREQVRSGILGQFHCEWISYDFEIPRESFNVRTFSRKTGVKAGERWSAGIYPKESDVGYHVHFKGITRSHPFSRVRRKRIHLFQSTRTSSMASHALQAQEFPSTPFFAQSSITGLWTPR